MVTYNLTPNQSILENYSRGMLPQRNDQNKYYQDSSCRSRLDELKLSSENRRIIRKTDSFSFELKPISFDLTIKKNIFNWLKGLEWDFPISSVKTIFTNHIFNFMYVWKQADEVVAYTVCYFDSQFSHVAYVFYNPKYDHSDLPIRLVIQAIVDSHHQGLKYCYLGRFTPQTGYYKRNMPGFEYFDNGKWLDYQKK